MHTLYPREEMMKKRNKKRLRTELRLIYDDLRNFAEGEMLHRFDEALSEGELLEFRGTDDELQDLLVAAVDRYFGVKGAGDDAPQIQGS